MTLSQANLAIIQQAIIQSPISRPAMQEDLIDHLCCEVEHRMARGCDFEKAFAQAILLLAPNGLKELEQETFLLLNSKTIVMKKLTYFSGALFSIFSSLGIFFKILHWLGANELLILGFGGLLFVFIPLLVLTNRKPSAESSFERRKNLIGVFSLVLFSIGAVLKVLHFAGANEALLLATALFSFGFLPMTFLKMYRQSIAS